MMAKEDDRFLLGLRTIFRGEVLNFRGVLGFVCLGDFFFGLYHGIHRHFAENMF